MTDTQPLAPTDAEIDALWVGQQLTVPQLVQRRVIARAAQGHRRSNGSGPQSRSKP